MYCGSSAVILNLTLHLLHCLFIILSGLIILLSTSTGSLFNADIEKNLRVSLHNRMYYPAALKP